jgi:predicted enzyme related to lactoylglutathione lyase
MPQRDDFIVMLHQADQQPVSPNGAHNSWDAYFWCIGVDGLHAELAANGAEIVYGPEDQEHYGMREFAIKDIDGYMLAFAEDLDSISSSGSGHHNGGR